MKQISIHSTARVETLCLSARSNTPGTFQSTPPRGWRHRAGYCEKGRKGYFNPLHREGGDLLRPISAGRSWRFQSTPPRGWRQSMDLQQRIPNIHFNPLHREGGDSGRSHLTYTSGNFNPLHREGGDTVVLPAAVVPSRFQSTPPRGWRRPFGRII